MRAAKLAAFAVLLGSAGVLAQPPGGGYQPLNYKQQAAQQQGGQQPAGQQPAYAANGLPLPPGYRPRTPPPQAQPQAQSQAQPNQPVGAPGSMPGGSGGTVMYFQKPADALTATGGPGSTVGATAGSGEVAQVNDPNRVQPIPVPAADVPAPTLPPPPPPSRYLPAGGAAARPLTPPITRPELPAPGVVAAPPAGMPEVPVFSKQPPIDPIPPSTSLKKDVKIVPVDPKQIQLPPRESIFTVYNDVDLERAVIGRMIQDRITEQQNRLKIARDLLKEKKDPKEIAELEQTIKEIEKTLQELQSIKDPLSEPSYRFPALPVISPPGVAYKPKTATYEPRKVIVEPGYVVHRRLHFEEKNAERTGWDIGPAQTLLSAAYFWKDTLLWPQSLASGCAYGFWDTSAGKCLPGSPSPYYLYPPGLTVTGSVVEGAVITGGFFIFP